MVLFSLQPCFTVQSENDGGDAGCLSQRASLKNSLNKRKPGADPFSSAHSQTAENCSRMEPTCPGLRDAPPSVAVDPYEIHSSLAPAFQEGGKKGFHY